MIHQKAKTSSGVPNARFCWKQTDDRVPPGQGVVGVGGALKVLDRGEWCHRPGIKGPYQEEHPFRIPE